MNLKQSIPLYSIQNARELGGYHTADGRTIKSGLLLRTARLNEISHEDIRTLKVDYRLQHIVDFRMSSELPGMEDPVIDGVAYHHLDVINMAELSSANLSDEAFDFSSLDVFQITDLTIRSGLLQEDMYIGFLTCDTGKKAFSDFFRILLAADPDRAVLWHCTGGKDRTGLAAMLLLSAFGVDETIILSDYLLTNAYNSRRIVAMRQMMKEKGYQDEYIEKALLIFDAVDERYMRNAIDYLNKEYGSVVGYIRDRLHITQTEINALKAKYLR